MVGSATYYPNSQHLIIYTALRRQVLISETRTFVLEESCKYNTNTLIFQNNLGGFDNFTFYLGDMSMTDIERKDMKVNVDTVVGNDIVYSMNEREKVTYYTKEKRDYKINVRLDNRSRKQLATRINVKS